jgi:hypothetical protein
MKNIIGYILALIGGIVLGVFTGVILGAQLQYLRQLAS